MSRLDKQRQRHVDPIYYTANDVAEILRYKRTAAYGVIKRLNDELEQKGYITRPGLIPKKYFAARYGWMA